MTRLEKLLNTYANNEKTTGSFLEYSLEGIYALLDALAHPERDLSIIHVAGTNGKGSTCHMLESIFRSHEYHTGLFTSPHLERVNERIRFDGEEISDDDFLSILIEVDACAKTIHSTQMTYFDILTASALLYFRNKKTDMVILETGMGGRLDSTNAVHPRAVVLTPISYDHTHVLGHTLEEITKEKAGIIKKGTPVITSNSEPIIINIITRKSESTHSPLLRIGSDFHADNIIIHNDTTSFSFRNDSYRINDISINHPGKFQCENAAAAIQGAISAGLNPDSQKMQYAFSSLRIPGRMEHLCENPLIIFDPAHNEHALMSLAETLKQRYPDAEITAFVAFMKDKNPEHMIELIRTHISQDIYYLTIDDPRAYVPSTTDSFAAIIPASEDTPCEYLASIHTEKIFLFTGSFRIYHFATRAARFFVDRNNFSDSITAGR
jgi:dihydrofolate synthase/folylpolyglutamate synthase